MSTDPKPIRHFGQSETGEVLTAPDHCTKYLASAIENRLDRMEPGSVVEVDFANEHTRLDIAEWCLNGGRRPLNPFAHYLDQMLVIEN